MQEAGGGHLEMLQWARANGCPWNEKELHIAAQNGHEAVVRALIEAGADVNKVNDNGMTPLYVGRAGGPRGGGAGADRGGRGRQQGK